MTPGPKPVPVNNPPSIPSLIEVLSDRQGAFVLESGGERGRWSYLGWNPHLILRGDAEEAVLMNPETGRILKEGTGLDLLEETLHQHHHAPSNHAPPFTGGAVGYFGFDVGHQFESLPEIARRDFYMPELYWCFYNQFLCFDHRESQLYRIEVNPTFCGDRSLSSPLNELIDRAREKKGKKPCTTPPSPDHLETNMSQNEFLRMVRKAKKYIEKGHIYQVNLSRRLLLKDIQKPGPLYQKLRRVNPAPYSGYLRGKRLAVLSSSPELLLRKRNRTLTTRPIKGTRSRERNEKKDRKRQEELKRSEKDLSELHMIVDLARNDLGRVCEPGTVQTTSLHDLETFSHVHHLVGTVQGTMQKDMSLKNLLRAVFPGGSITGAPKIRALEIIDELEPTRRQVYTGSLGWIGYNGNLDLNICIRTMEWHKNKLALQVGGGIVADSDPEEEYRETVTKSVGLLKSLNMDVDPKEFDAR